MFWLGKKKEKEFEKMFWEKRYFVESIVKKHTRNLDIADDLIQQVFIKLYLNAGKFIAAENQNSYIYRITMNEIIDFFRKKKIGLNEVSLSPELEAVLPGTVNYENSEQAQQVYDAFMNELSKSPTKRKSVISMRVLDEKTFGEISDILGISEVSARNLFSIGMKDIRKNLVKVVGESYV